MSQHRLDLVDDAIVGVLRADPRASLSRIGTHVGLSADAVRSRLVRLTGEGVVTVVGVVDPATVGLSASATVGVQVRGDVQAFVARLRCVPCVTFLAVTVGDRNVVAEVMAADDSALVDAVYGEIAAVPGVHQVELWKHLRPVKCPVGRRSWRRAQPARPAAGQPEPQHPARGPVELDELDARLLRVLAGNPRAKFSELGATLGVSYSLARRRSQALFDSGAVEAVTVVAPVTAACTALVGITTAGEGVQRLADLPEVAALVRTAGRFQALAEVTCPSEDELVAVVDARLAGAPGVASVTVYPYVRTEAMPFPWEPRTGHGPAAHPPR